MNEARVPGPQDSISVSKWLTGSRKRESEGNTVHPVWKKHQQRHNTRSLGEGDSSPDPEVWGSSAEGAALELSLEG